MAIVRPDLSVAEIRAILELFPKSIDRAKQLELFRARRELERALERGVKMEANEREQVRKMRASRRAQNFDDEPLISVDTLRRRRS